MFFVAIIATMMVTSCTPKQASIDTDGIDTTSVDSIKVDSCLHDTCSQIPDSIN